MRKTSMSPRLPIALFTLLASSPLARADQFHYKPLLIGERAAGLGGAFTAISDDPSGVCLNPAGIAYAMDSYFSLSANALSFGEERYKSVFTTRD